MIFMSFQSEYDVKKATKAFKTLRTWLSSLASKYGLDMIDSSATHFFNYVFEGNRKGLIAELDSLYLDYTTLNYKDHFTISIPFSNSLVSWIHDNVFEEK